MARKPGIKSPLHRRGRRKLSPTAKFITVEEQAAIDKWLMSNDVEVLDPVDPDATVDDGEASE